MSDFEEAVEYVIKMEGGLRENISDGGGITNFGISLRFLREIPTEKLRRYSIFEPVNEQTIRNLEEPQAKFIYRGEFWDEAPFQVIESQKLCNYFFDMCINLGTHQATKLIQRAVWAKTNDRGVLKDDGILGGRTVEYINSFGEELMPILIAIRASFYRLIVELNPSQKMNLNGWLNRAYAA